jgi:AcrR family transcriptional regulator
MASSPSPEPKWRRRSDERPAQLMAAALTLFAQRGFAATKTEEIARAAGVTVGTVYRYFESKEALFEATVQESILPLVEEAEAQIKSFSGPTVELYGRLVRYAWEHASTPAMANVARVVLAEAHNFPDVARAHVERVIVRIQKAYCQLLERGIQRGEFRPMDVSLAARVMVAPILYGAMYLNSLQPYDSRTFSAERYVDSVIDLFLQGITAEPGRTPSKKPRPRRARPKRTR